MQSKGYELPRPALVCRPTHISRLRQAGIAKFFAVGGGATKPHAEVAKLPAAAAPNASSLPDSPRVKRQKKARREALVAHASASAGPRNYLLQESQTVLQEGNTASGTEAPAAKVAGHAEAVDTAAVVPAEPKPQLKRLRKGSKQVCANNIMESSTVVGCDSYAFYGLECAPVAQAVASEPSEPVTDLEPKGTVEVSLLDVRAVCLQSCLYHGFTTSVQPLANICRTQQALQAARNRLFASIHVSLLPCSSCCCFATIAACSFEVQASLLWIEYQNSMQPYTCCPCLGGDMANACCLSHLLQKEADHTVLNEVVCTASPRSARQASPEASQRPAAVATLPSADTDQIKASPPAEAVINGEAPSTPRPEPSTSLSVPSDLGSEEAEQAPASKKLKKAVLQPMRDIPKAGFAPACL